MSNFTDTLKEAKVKVTKNGGAGFYIYNGINFSVEFNSEEFDTKYWEINLDYDNCPSVVYNRYSYLGEAYSNNFETKGDLVWELFLFDQSLSK
tara:strand:- start:1228 stop:1506 length:279 start_codon:yes stop_codon:yes gene_type:complete